ncbi:MAG: hypothetical protein IK134_12875 [Oscillospiraceae bacterium]|nr:hypothetical protein [Oscillospiraceae bacterium]
MSQKKQFQYQNQFIAEKYDRFTATFSAGKKAIYREFAVSHGESLNAYINRLIAEDMSFPEWYREFAERHGETLHVYIKRLIKEDMEKYHFIPEEK